MFLNLDSATKLPRRETVFAFEVSVFNTKIDWSISFPINTVADSSVDVGQLTTTTSKPDFMKANNVCSFLSFNKSEGFDGTFPVGMYDYLVEMENFKFYGKTGKEESFSER